MQPDHEWTTLDRHIAAGSAQTNAQVARGEKVNREWFIYGHRVVFLHQIQTYKKKKKR